MATCTHTQHATKCNPRNACNMAAWQQLATCDATIGNMPTREPECASMVCNGYAVRCILTTRSTNVRRADSGGKACQAADGAAAHAAMLQHVGPCCHVASAVSQRGALRCGRVATRCSGRVATRCSGRACQVVEVGRIAHTRRQPDFVLVRIPAHREGTRL